ncbi:hypothetical protein AZI86_09040 [Bdellovibrio bacteriovorus]|uniref:histidine kinase n=2 Tax=Bdellovibrio bacteriovorus TaxID=959 RepID=A0A150WRY8_BDEBC|nr:hypothetical protein AZI86_09040 [Bdellovibrio bacteriovorus]
MTSTVMVGWILDIPRMRSLFPGLPQMIPLTATVVVLLSSSLLLLSLAADHPSNRRSKFAASFCGLVVLIGLYSFSLHLIPYSSALEFSLFRDKVLSSDGVMYSGKMSVQTSLASVFLGLSLLFFRLPGRRKGFYLFEGFLVAAASLCFIAIITYMHDVTMSGPSKMIGMSLPTSVCFFLLSLGTVFLKVDEGLVKNLRGRDGAGLFLRFYIPFSILFPLFSSVFIHWGEEAGHYPPVFSKSLFVVVIIFSLLILGAFMSIAIRKLEIQRMSMEKAESRAALQESQDSLNRTQESLEMALEASSMGTWETDLQTGRLVFSAMAKSLIQVSEESVTSEIFFSRIHPDDQEACRIAREDALQKGADLNVDFRYVFPDGSIRWFRSQGRAKHGLDGKAVRLTGTILDITSEKNHQAQLEAALKEAESASSLKSTFLANMSHEIRTPLGAILGFADVLNDAGLTEEERSKYAQIIRRNGETLSHILNDILDLSKVESGHLNVERIGFSLRSLVNEVVSLLEVRAKEKELQLHVDIDPNLKDHITSDPLRLKQILMNLVGNAIKFTSQGSVTISVTSGADESIRFAITDTGVGIDKEKQSKLFQAFSQADSSITRLFGGTGLGLVLSQKLAELLGGGIELTRSELKVGSTFTLTIHEFKGGVTKASDKTNIRKTDVVANNPLQGKIVLLTEDSPDIQKLLTLILQKEGAEVDLAINGVDCLQKYNKRSYDVILMDIQMPIMDGYTAARKLREEGFTRSIIALTAHAMSDEHQRCIQAGCDGYLSKPVQRQKLVDMILEYT